MADKVLVVDDETDLLCLVAYTLRAEGFLVVEAGSGAEALQKVEEERPDVVVLDVMLPDMTGVEVCKRLRESRDSTTLPIIMLSARVQVADKIRGLAAGADEYVTKPLDMTELVARVQALLSRTRRLEEAHTVQTGKVLGFIGAKGGVGTTTVAVNVAMALSQSKRDVIAVELAPFIGTLRFYANRDKARSLDELLDLDPTQITEQKLSQCLVTASSGTRLLLGPSEAHQIGNLRSEQAEAICSGLARMADLVVVDFGCFQSDANRSAMQLCS